MQERSSPPCGGSIWDKYQVKLLPGALRNLDSIYEYIATELGAVQSAEKLINQLEETIFSLEVMPRRGAKRRTGAYASRGYRQLFVGNFVLVYRVDDEKKAGCDCSGQVCTESVLA